MSPLHIVLVEPQIPPNAGNVARLCAAMKLTLHLVGPLGFSTEDRYLKRAGLDYWPYVDWHVYSSWIEFLKTHSQGRHYYLTTKSKKSYTDVLYQKGDYLVFGSETKGLSEDIRKGGGENTITIPMKEPGVRSLNLSSAVAMVAGEALRQIG